MPMFSKGIVLFQHKEPAFSNPIVRFVNPQTDSMQLELNGISASSESETVIEIAKRAKIVDERDGVPLYKKLKSAAGASIIIVDAVDDEPYVSSKIGPLLHNGEEMSGGLELCKRITGCNNAVIIVYKLITDIHTRIPRSVCKIKVERLRGGYPTDQARWLRRFGQGKKLIIGAGALIHLSRAVYSKKLQTTIFVTAAGNCVENPMNMEVSIGTSVARILERCGLSARPTRVVCGGSMTGAAIADAEGTLVTYNTRAVLAIRENQRDARYNCIGCGRCEQVCPLGLNPMYIHRFVENSYYANLSHFDAELCSGCGTCSYICPSKLQLAESVRAAKQYALRNPAGSRGAGEGE